MNALVTDYSLIRVSLMAKLLFLYTHQKFVCCWHFVIYLWCRMKNWKDTLQEIMKSWNLSNVNSAQVLSLRGNTFLITFKSFIWKAKTFSVTCVERCLGLISTLRITFRGSMYRRNRSTVSFVAMEQFIVQIWGGMLSRFIRNWRKQSVTFAEKSFHTRAIWWGTTIGSMTHKNKYIRQQTLMSQILFDNFNELIQTSDLRGHVE